MPGREVAQVGDAGPGLLERSAPESRAACSASSCSSMSVHAVTEPCPSGRSNGADEDPIRTIGAVLAH